MDTELLKTFLEVSRTRHFGRAAEALYLTQSAVSFRIRQLENQLGVNLFTRHRNNIRLTAAGEKLLPYAETLMNTWQAARKEVAHTSRHNEFSIGASASLWECMLNNWLGRLYQRQEPQNGLQFEARIAQRQSLVKQLHERQLDLLITTEAPKMDEFSSELLGHFTLALYCSSPARMKSELNYLRLEWGPDFQQHEAGLIAADEVPVLTTSSAELARQQLNALNGCSWLPVNWANEKGGLHTVADSATLSRPLYAIWLQNSDKYSLICDLLKTDILDRQ
ncbi:transcriptional regulator [Salmonella enterica subsp. arizonae serovar 18:z4,z23:- str. CVM N26624]|uniref:HTH-type transcriptional regulator HdfR n=1 Tax=Salmonella enterica subsp. arizonae serovar 18:z4,z23:- str. CVM N26626 TaxID=1395119 RepID=A0A3S5YP98_SALER|nr:transcriptional regulator HdfR [Salmonella enterica subsp. arizonae serovar 18:z4,z23:-]KTY99121.1 transcriptional regulator HdfR [Salmonella enterica subsp. arizonae serovar 18:z4,z23:- str. CVM N31597]OLV94441.1 transcriptional regulator [Salmonella enterica subsp. arizonae serovar 18:z4,z23:- str. CVM N26625]OLW03668.1 transcriptional regulator [Salmonella enterica subsp. arizonae serovar 18:z4,z23:- str. CVM N26624]OLW03877.1 transcriptional regulator [Salmonella enterica subsp. arizonae